MIAIRFALGILGVLLVYAGVYFASEKRKNADIQKSRELRMSRAPYLTEDDRMQVMLETLRTGKPVSAYKDDNGKLVINNHLKGE